MPTCIRMRSDGMPTADRERLRESPLEGLIHMQVLAYRSAVREHFCCWLGIRQVCSQFFPRTSVRTSPPWTVDIHAVCERTITIRHSRGTTATFLPQEPPSHTRHRWATFQLHQSVDRINQANGTDLHGETPPTYLSSIYTTCLQYCILPILRIHTANTAHAYCQYC